MPPEHNFKAPNEFHRASIWQQLPA